jgi:hypothetical protein
MRFSPRGFDKVISHQAGQHGGMAAAVSGDDIHVFKRCVEIVSERLPICT